MKQKRKPDTRRNRRRPKRWKRGSVSIRANYYLVLKDLAKILDKPCAHVIEECLAREAEKYGVAIPPPDESRDIVYNRRQMKQLEFDEYISQYFTF